MAKSSHLATITRQAIIKVEAVARRAEPDDETSTKVAAVVRLFDGEGEMGATAGGTFANYAAFEAWFDMMYPAGAPIPKTAPSSPPATT